ncbi:MAG: hypothetical protein AB7R89_12055 [Dehalococcoidia bacterium]
MPAVIEPIRLRDEQVVPVAHILARAFFDDPMPDAFRYWTMRRLPRD